MHLELEIGVRFFAHLDVVRDLLSGHHYATAALVQAEIGVNQFALVLEQPDDAVVGSAAFFVGCQAQR